MRLPWSAVEIRPGNVDDVGVDVLRAAFDPTAREDGINFVRL
jgi:hypothetical protein